MKHRHDGGSSPSEYVDRLVAHWFICPNYPTLIIYYLRDTAVDGKEQLGGRVQRPSRHDELWTNR